MKGSFTLIAPLAFAALLSSAMRLSAADAPPFLEVGKSYNLLFNGKRQFKVLEIGKDGWVKIAIRATNEVAWINTNAVPVIAPFPSQPTN